jgi:hypothetical protein
MYVKVAVKYLDHDPKSDSEKRSFASRHLHELDRLPPAIPSILSRARHLH